MQFTSAALAGLLAFGVAALPNPLEPNVGTGGSSSSNQCDGRRDVTLFEGELSKRPLKDDCLALRDNLRNGTALGGASLTLKGAMQWQVGTCQLSVEIPDDLTADIGSDDTADWIDSFLQDLADDDAASDDASDDDCGTSAIGEEAASICHQHDGKPSQYIKTPYRIAATQAAVPA